MNISIPKIKGRLFLILVFILISSHFIINVNAQQKTNLQYRDTLCTILFPTNGTALEPYYKSNQQALFAIRSYFDTANFFNIDSVIVVGSTSPDGSKEINNSIAHKRAQSLKNLFISDNTVPASILKTAILENTWLEVFDLIKKDPNFPNKDQTLVILQQEPESIRMWMLKNLNYIEEYNYLINVTFSQLKNATTILIYKSDNNGQSNKLNNTFIEANRVPNDKFIENPYNSTSSSRVTQPPKQILREIVLVGESGTKPIWSQKPLFAFKTNLLYDVATIINASLEVPIGQHLSIAGEFIFPWWLNEEQQNALQIYNANLEVKYWFKPRDNQNTGRFSTMTGWFLGVYGGVGVYDLEYQGKGYQGESLFSTGLMGGYAHSIGENLRMEYSLGVGYMQTHYRSYESKFSTTENKWILYRQDTGTASWIGPTHAKISLVWLLSRNYKKGGVKQ